MYGKNLKFFLIAITVFGLVTGISLSHQKLIQLISPENANASGNDKPLISPTEPRERDFYALNSEQLGADEMRVIATRS